jgi:hypothetical protein
MTGKGVIKTRGGKKKTGKEYKDSQGVVKRRQEIKKRVEKERLGKVKKGRQGEQ